MGLRLLLPDINKSEIKYTGKAGKIRMGLMQLKELGREAMEAIIEERTRNGPFASLDEFLRRTLGYVHVRDARILIKAGCFDHLARGLSRAQLMWKVLRFFARRSGQMASVQESINMFSSPFLSRGSSSLYSERKASGRIDGHNNIKHEIDTFGFPVSIHPLDRYQRIIKRLNHVPAKELRHWAGKEVTTVGWMVTSKSVYSRDGRPMKFVTFEDTTGIYEAALFPDVYHRYCHVLAMARPYILRGKVERDRGAITLTVHQLEPIKPTAIHKCPSSHEAAAQQCGLQPAQS